MTSVFPKMNFEFRFYFPSFFLLSELSKLLAQQPAIVNLTHSCLVYASFHISKNDLSSISFS